MKIEQNIKQTQILTQAQAQSLHILSLNGQELVDFLLKEQEENPLLELLESSRPNQEMGSWLRDHRPLSPVSYFQDEEGWREIAAPQLESLADYLFLQLPTGSYHKTQQQALRLVVDSLDQRGFLTVSAQELSGLTGVSTQDFEWAIDKVRNLEPTGVGAVDVIDCLMLQLKKGPHADPLTEKILREFPDYLAKRQYAAIARGLHTSPSRIEKCMERVKNLNPHPMSAFSPSMATPIIPDLLASFVDKLWQVELNDGWTGNLGISVLYERLSRSGEDKAAHDYLEEKLKRAKQLLEAVTKRRETLCKLSLFLLSSQEDFLLHGAPLKPLSPKEVAAFLSVHESTVSRSIKNKYIQTPHGCFPLQKFFSQAAVESSELSRDHVLLRIKALINQEDKVTPLTDQRITDLLTAEGVSISRRTVVKYRELCDIATAYVRKKL